MGDCRRKVKDGDKDGVSGRARNVGAYRVSGEDRSRLFDEWAAHYDSCVRDGGDFPHGGYEQVLDEVLRLAAVRPNMAVLELGVGTGSLASRFVAAGCTVWGLDFSSEMLAKARTKVPDVKLVQASILGEWPTEIQRRFDRVVSAYVFHEYDLRTKVSLLQRLIKGYLANDGRIVIGDIAFSSVGERERAHKRWVRLWDEKEDYWAADEAIAACRDIGVDLQYSQISSCGGVFVVESPDRE